MINICNFHINNLLNNNNNHNNIHNCNIHFSWFFFINYYVYVSWKNAVLPNYLNAFSFYLYVTYYIWQNVHFTSEHTVQIYCIPQCNALQKCYFFYFHLFLIIFTQDWFQNNHSVVFKTMNWTELTEVMMWQCSILLFGMFIVECSL